jgi:hypothetical protein
MQQPNIELVVQDLKNQISRLSEERALYFALANQKAADYDSLKQQFDQKVIELETQQEEEKKKDALVIEKNAEIVRLNQELDELTKPNIPAEIPPYDEYMTKESHAEKLLCENGEASPKE